MTTTTTLPAPHWSRGTAPRTDAQVRSTLRVTGRARTRTTTRRALLLEDVHPDAAVSLHDAGFDVEVTKGALRENELAEALQDVDVLGIRSRTQVTDRVLAAAPQLLAIGAFCIGTNQIDLEAATRRGIAVFNAPYSNTRSVVELAVAEMIALHRRLGVRNSELHAGSWNKSAAGSHEVRGRTLGIVGYGSIGCQLSVVAEALGMTVLFHDLVDRLPLGNARRCASLQELLAQSDVVSLHVDGRPDNAGLIGDEQLSQMRPGSYLLNLSRGHVVDVAALRRHLISRRLAGAAVDVHPEESAAAGERFDSPLRGVPNVLLTPHIAGSTLEAQQDIASFVSRKLAQHVHDGATHMSVNLPQLVLPGSEGTSRLSVLSTGEAVLDRIGTALAEHGVRTHALQSATRDNRTYLLADLSAQRPAAVRSAACDLLQHLPSPTRVELRH